MIPHPDHPAESPFYFRECFLMPMPIGRKAVNLKELLQGIRETSEGVLSYHLIQHRLAPGAPAAEYPNDFASWAATALQDARLAEKLSSFDPFDYAELSDLRTAVGDILDEYLWDIQRVPWARPGYEFHFLEASTVVMRSHIQANTLREFRDALASVGIDAVYYHFFESRWRLGREKDDFSTWIAESLHCPELASAMSGVDVYFYTLSEIRTLLLDLVEGFMGEPGDRDC